MRTAILQSGILLALILGPSAATAQTELFFATGVDSTGWAQAQSNADGHVLIESPQYPRGLWLHLVDESGDALAGIQVEYQGRPDSLVAIHCVDPAGEVRETLVWTWSEGDLLRLTLKPRISGALLTRLTPIDWRIDPSAASLLEPVAETWLIGWETVAAFLRAHWPSQTGRVAVQIKSSAALTTLVVKKDLPEAIETLVVHLQQLYQRVGASLEEIAAIEIEVQIFKGNLALLEGVIHLNPFFFEDVALATAVRKALGQAPGSPIVRQEVTSLIELRASDSGIHILAGLEHLSALQKLSLYENQITDVTPLAQLTSLGRLSLGRNQITDVKSLAQLTNLQELGLSENQITDVKPLTQLISLRKLWLSENQITDVTPLAQLTNLRELWLSENRITDVTPLARLTTLRRLSLSENRITDVTPLAQLTNLQELHLAISQIADVTPLADLILLESLALWDNQITDVTPLANLKNLKELYLLYNQIVDVTPLANLTNLNRLSLSDNQITDVTPLANLKNLKELYLLYNQIADMTPLTQLTNLKRLNLRNNQIKDVTPLVTNAGLGKGDEVDLRDNPLSDQALTEQIPTLQARGVRVQY